MIMEMFLMGLMDMRYLREVPQILFIPEKPQNP
jgi:hypothetical protein